MNPGAGLRAEHQAIEHTVALLRQFVRQGKDADVRYGEGHRGLGFYAWYQVEQDISLFAVYWRFLGEDREIVEIAKCIVEHERKVGTL